MNPLRSGAGTWGGRERGARSGTPSEARGSFVATIADGVLPVFTQGIIPRRLTLVGPTPCPPDPRQTIICRAFLASEFRKQDALNVTVSAFELAGEVQNEWAPSALGSRCRITCGAMIVAAHLEGLPIATVDSQGPGRDNPGAVFDAWFGVKRAPLDAPAFRARIDELKAELERVGSRRGLVGGAR